MYSAPLRHAPFRQDESGWRYQQQREEYVRQLQNSHREDPASPEIADEKMFPPQTQSLSALLDLVSPEDSALLSLIVFLLCDNTENDVVLLGILLYVLLSK